MNYLNVLLKLKKKKPHTYARGLGPFPVCSSCSFLSCSEICLLGVLSNCGGITVTKFHTCTSPFLCATCASGPAVNISLCPAHSWAPEMSNGYCPRACSRAIIMSLLTSFPFLLRPLHRSPICRVGFIVCTCSLTNSLWLCGALQE